ncbi:MAG TPA: hypothetical protein PKC13_31365 [Blastocatellia bacterium]|nr:hypothetical protein [Blastocatellia bacterium]HMY71907.1 hypothetical protein [Blastocatellia bacterium]
MKLFLRARTVVATWLLERVDLLQDVLDKVKARLDTSTQSVRGRFLSSGSLNKRQGRESDKFAAF